VSGPGVRPVRLIDLEGEARSRAVPALDAGFTGIYRWHAKRTLRRVSAVRAAELQGVVVGVSLLELLVPEVGYVYYIAVLPDHRRTGIGGALLDDALARFRGQGAEVVYAAVQQGNHSSLALFVSRGFRVTERKERSYRDGGLGAWGLRSRMLVVSGEALLGVRLANPRGPIASGEAAGPSGGLRQQPGPGPEGRGS
jgi:ribosomal protein S18 acetylase RimI-like enzyme